MDFISLLLYTLYIFVMFAILSAVYRQYVIRQKLKNFPQTSGYPFIGVALELVNMPDYERRKWILSFMEKCKEEIFVQWIGSKPFIHVYKPEHLEQICSSTVNIRKGEFYNMMSSWLGNGLLLSTGKQWFHDRKLIGPTFHFSILDQFAVVLSEKAEILTKCLEREVEKDPGKPIDIFPFIINATLDIICETAMGVNVRAQETVIEYTSRVSTASTLIMDRMIQPWYWIDWLYNSLPTGKKHKLAVDILHKFTKEVISKRKAKRQSQTNSNTELEDEECNIDKRKRKAFLDLLLELNAKDDTPLTDDELRAQVDTFMFEGHDTTAVGITWTLFLLGNNFEHQEKVHEELEEVFRDSETPASVKELTQLKYLDRVIQESLRLFPSVPIIHRKLIEDVKLDNTYILPKNETIVLAIELAHRNPKVWPDPLKFDPDRFLPENTKHRNPYAYIPFSAGPRNCIGKRFAQLEEKTVLVAILRKWRIKSVKTADEIKYSDSLVLRPSEEVLIHFTPKK